MQKNLLKSFKAWVVLMITFLLSLHAIAQVTDSTKSKSQKEYKNTIKLNLTSFAVYNGFQLNYERVLTNHTSITVWGGPVQFPMPTAIANSPIKLNTDKQKTGYTFGIDHRYYLLKENKYAIPHGIYLAPYVSYYHFQNTRDGRDTASLVNLSVTTTMDFFNIGAELGYQFVIIKNRFVIDCVLAGPSLSNYNFNVKFNGSVNASDNEHLQDILNAIIDKYPGLKFLTNGPKTVSTSGVSNSWASGFRWAIHIGYRF